MSYSHTRRKPVACHRCHRKKIRCNPKPAGPGCKNCADARENCVYPMRDRVITVSEAYVRDLQFRAATGHQTAPLALTSSSQPRNREEGGDAFMETQEDRLKNTSSTLQSFPLSTAQTYYEYAPLASGENRGWSPVNVCLN